MIHVEDLQLAVALRRSASLSAAARTLNVTPSALSMRLRKLEAKLGVALAVRTARQLSLTPEGEQLAAQAQTLLAQLESIPESFSRTDQRLTGTIRVVAPFGYGRHHVAPILASFAKQHPGLCIQLDLREAPWRDRRDADVLIHIGAIRDSTWIARTLANNERWLCASPSYLQRHGVPRTLQDLQTHACICIRENEEDMTLWSCRPVAKAGIQSAAKESVRIGPRLLTNDGSVARGWAERGLGVVLRSRWDLVDALETGKLQRILPDWQFDSAPIMLLVPTRNGRSSRVQALCDFFEAETKAHAV